MTGHVSAKPPPRFGPLATCSRIAWKISIRSSAGMATAKILPDQSGALNRQSQNCETSSSSLQFFGAQFGTNGVVSTAIDNFGLELWLTPSPVTGSHSPTPTPPPSRSASTASAGLKAKKIAALAEPEPSLLVPSRLLNPDR